MKTFIVLKSKLKSVLTSGRGSGALPRAHRLKGSCPDRAK